MSICTYDNYGLYVKSRTGLAEKIEAIEAIESQMLDRMLEAASNPNIANAMYELDDGQVRVKSNTRNLTELTASLDALRKIKQVYINQYDGRTVVLRDKNTYR